MILLTFLLFFQTMTPCTDKSPEYHVASTYIFDELNNAPTDLDVWIGHEYGENTQREIDHWQGKIIYLKAWAIKTKMNLCLKQQYLRWIQFYQDRLNSAKLEMKDHHTEKQMKEYNDKIDKQRKDDKEYIMTHPNMPKPPQETPQYTINHDGPPTTVAKQFFDDGYTWDPKEKAFIWVSPDYSPLNPTLPRVSGPLTPETKRIELDNSKSEWTCVFELMDKSGPFFRLEVPKHAKLDYPAQLDYNVSAIKGAISYSSQCPINFNRPK